MPGKEIKLTTENHNTLTKDLAIRDPFQLMDLMDDEAVLAEMQGQITDKWAYVFTNDEGKEVAGLSKVGVDQATREMAKQGEVVDEDDITYSVDPTNEGYVLFQAKVIRVAVSKDGTRIPLEKKYGHKRQCLNIITKKEGVTDRPNQFWYEQGAAKALRNATSRVIPEEIRVKIIAYAKEHGKARRVEQEKVTTGIQPPKPKTQAEKPANGNGKSGPPNDQLVAIDKVETSEGSSAKGLWKKYSVKVGSNFYSTFSDTYGEAAMRAWEEGLLVVLEYKQEGKYKNITHLEVSNVKVAEQGIPAGQEADVNSPM